jgi:hypothetical protein
MRKILLMTTLAVATAFASSVSAQPRTQRVHDAAIAAPAAGAVTGTLVGVGVSEAWFGSTAAAALPATAAGAAAIGGAAGIGAVTLIHAATTPCDGFQVLFSGFLTSPRGCVDGHWVGD